MLFPASKYICNELPQKYLESIFCVFKQLTDNRPLFQTAFFSMVVGLKFFSTIATSGKEFKLVNYLKHPPLRSKSFILSSPLL